MLKLFQPLVRVALECAVALSCASAAAAQGAELGKADLMAVAQAARSRIRDLTVEFTFNAEQAPAIRDFLGARFHAVVTVKGPKAYIVREFGAAPQVNPRTFGREVAYNGKRSTMHALNMGSAVVTLEHNSETRT